MKKILITGAGGFVAQHLIRHILQQESDSEILGVDVAPVCASESMGIRYRQLDLTGRTELAALLEKFAPDWIIHLAAVSSVSDSWRKPEECFLNNTGIFLNLVEALRLLGLKSRLLSVGSSEEYGPYPTEKMPLREEYELHPGNPYAVARVAQEQLSRLYAQNYGLDIVMTRSFNHIGPGQRDTFVVPSFVRQLVELSRKSGDKVLHTGNVEVIRDFLDVRDVADAYCRLLETGKSGEVYNVCSGIGTRLHSVIDKIADLLRIEVEILVDPARLRPSDNPVMIGDNARLRAATGWEPRHTLEATLNEMIRSLNA